MQPHKRIDISTRFGNRCVCIVKQLYYIYIYIYSIYIYYIYIYNIYIYTCVSVDQCLRYGVEVKYLLTKGRQTGVEYTQMKM